MIEQREILGALEELAIARAEIRQLREVLGKSGEQIEGLQGEVRELRVAVKALEQVWQSAERVMLLQERALGTYQKLAAAEGERADRAIARAERLERWSWLGPVLGIASGLAGGFAIRW